MMQYDLPLALVKEKNGSSYNWVSPLGGLDYLSGVAPLFLKWSGRLQWQEKVHK